MAIQEFYSKFISKQEVSRLFDALRRVSSLDKGILMAAGEPGWPEWPPEGSPDGIGIRLRKA